VRQPEVPEDGSNEAWLGDCGADAAASAARAVQGVGVEDAAEELCPGDAACSGSGAGGLGRGVFPWRPWNDVVAPGGGGREHAVVGHEVRARTGDEGGQAFDEDERLEDDVGGAVGPGVGKFGLEANYFVEQSDTFGPQWSIRLSVTPVIRLP